MSTLAERVRGLLHPGCPLDPGIPIEEAPFVVLDTELTGLDRKRDSVVSIGALHGTGTRIALGESFHRLLRPASAMGRAGILVHGITPGDVAGRPTLDAVAEELLAFCRGRAVAGYFLALDLGFLARESAVLRAAGLGRRAVDTLGIHRWMHQQRHRHRGDFAVHEGETNLSALAQGYGIRVNGAHDALRDAYITAQLLQRQLRELPSLGVRTLGDLLRVGRP